MLNEEDRAITVEALSTKVSLSCEKADSEVDNMECKEYSFSTMFRNTIVMLYFQVSILF